MNIVLAPCIHLMAGFDRGKYTPDKLAIRVAQLMINEGDASGYGIEIHSKAGVRYIDIVLWKWKPWMTYMKKWLAKESKQ